ncbi:MAG: hypothetical protein VX204_00170 [Candidatus Thermoplasmatota archaeon]|nr:hypothetical protein [Candidatus Thermoplasmatota archaeon]
MRTKVASDSIIDVISELFEGPFWELSQAEISAVLRGLSARYLRMIRLNSSLSNNLPPH